MQQKTAKRKSTEIRQKNSRNTKRIGKTVRKTPSFWNSRIEKGVTLFEYAFLRIALVIILVHEISAYIMTKFH